MTAVRVHPWFIAVLMAFLVLATVYSITTPIFEAGDEIWHYPFVAHLATGHSLPVQDPAVKTLWEQEGGQPPLYYTLGAVLTAWIETGDLQDRLWINPHAKIGIPLVLGNKNLIVHTSAENFPWQNTALAVHLLRFFSILLSAGTVGLTYALALALKPDQRLSAVAAALVAFNPMFLFISASVNNDNLAVLLATLGLVLLVRLVRSTAALRDFILLGVVLGFGALSKVSVLGLLPVTAVVFMLLLRREWQAGRRDQLVRVIKGSLFCAALVVLIAGWWYLRNYILYGDPLAFNVWVAIAGARPTPATVASLLGEFQGFRISFWGNFGGVNIIAPGWVYTLLDAFTVAALVGLAAGLIRRTLPELLAIPALWLVLICGSLIRWTLLTLASQGRLVFPAIAAVAILLVYGLEQWTAFRLPHSLKRVAHLHAALAACLFLFALLAPFVLIAPAYALPARLATNAAVPNPTHILFEDQAELVGYALPVKSVVAGGELPLTVYWRGHKPMEEDYSVYVHFFDAGGNKVGQWDAFPGGGLYPTRLWQPGEVIVDIYQVPITVTARGPSVARVEVGLYRRLSLKNLTARDPLDRIVTPTLAQFKIAGQSNVQVENPAQYEFERKLALVGYSQRIEPGTVRVRLYWRAREAMGEDYTVFVHLVDAKGNTAAQQDNQPQRGAYPTRFWDIGETVADDYILALPPGLGDWRTRVGLYRAGDGSRLKVEGGGDSVLLPAIPSR